MATQRSGKAKRLIKLNVNDPSEQAKSFTFVLERPAVISGVLTKEGHLVIYAYDGTEPSAESEPVGCFDSGVQNEPWEA